MTSETIYLDHNATTPVDPRVVAAMDECHRRAWANASSPHRPGQAARRVLEDARARIAELLGAELTGAKSDRLIFTSGTTEANNLAILGIARRRRGRRDGRSNSSSAPGQIIISSIEHASVIEPAEYLLAHGWRLDTLPVTGHGIVRTEALPDLLSSSTALVSVILGNHETGAVQPVRELAAVCDGAAVPLHTDAAQVVGKLEVHFRRLGVAALSFGAHKFGGPPGVGALLLRHDVELEPLAYGGPHEGGLRPGTEPVALVVGMKTALELAMAELDERVRRMTALRDRFERALAAAVPEIVVHADAAPRLPQTSNVAFPGIDGQVLLVALDIAGVACSIGSACSSGAVQISPTLLAMGVPRALAGSSLRFSLGSTTTEDDIDRAVRRIASVCSQIGGLISWSAASGAAPDRGGAGRTAVRPPRPA